jgi:hypothetical protein
MNLLTILLILIVAYLLYIMLDSYRSLERELREIRLKCTGSRESAVASKDPTETLKDRLLSGLQKAVAVTSPSAMPPARQ